MMIPKVIARRPDGPSTAELLAGCIIGSVEFYFSPAPDNFQGYLESDDSWFDNNREAIVWFLENRDKLSQTIGSET